MEIWAQVILSLTEENLYFQYFITIFKDYMKFGN